MPISREACLELWYRALDEPIGIAFEMDDIRYFQAHLYQARKAHNDPELERLMIAIHPNGRELCIIHKDADQYAPKD